MDQLDRKIIALLRIDARRSFHEIGHQVGLSASAVKRRVDKLRAAGTVAGFTVVLDPTRLGWNMHAIVSLFCEGTMDANDVRAAIEGHPEVIAAYTVAGEASAIAHVLCVDTKELERLLERLRDNPGILRTETQIVLSALFERRHATLEGPE